MLQYIQLKPQVENRRRRDVIAERRIILKQSFRA
jgi:hypothetical protein